MTTIAYKDGIVAYDSRRCAGSTIVDDDFDKRVECNGVSFWFTGCVSDIEDLIGVYFGTEPRMNIDVTAIAFDGEKLVLCSCGNESGFWKEPLPLDKPYAMGSGSDHAWTAMDMGADAEHAVKAATRRDVHTGGTIRTFRIAPND